MGTKWVSNAPYHYGSEKSPEAMARVSKIGLSEQLPSSTLDYPLDIAMDLNQIKELIHKTVFCHYSLKGKIKLEVEFLLDLGMPQFAIPSFVLKVRGFCGHGCNMSDCQVHHVVLGESKVVVKE